VATVTDLEWSAPRRLEVWSFNGAEPGIEFSLSATEEDDTIYEIGAWVDADHLHLRRGSWSTEARVDAMLVHDAAGWHVEGGEANN
jgi:hypothetical protein